MAMQPERHYTTFEQYLLLVNNSEVSGKAFS